jgi:hypothetical protein
MERMKKKYSSRHLRALAKKRLVGCCIIAIVLILRGASKLMRDSFNQQTILAFGMGALMRGLYFA